MSDKPATHDACPMCDRRDWRDAKTATLPLLGSESRDVTAQTCNFCGFVWLRSRAWEDEQRRRNP